MRTSNHQTRRENARVLPTLSRNPIKAAVDFARSAGLANAFGVGVRCALVSVFLWAAPVYAQERLFPSAPFSGLAARNIASAAITGAISAIAGTNDPRGKISLFVGAAGE